MNELAESWLRFARNDLNLAKQAAASNELGGLAAFHCQQAVEKSLKALLVLAGAQPPRVHDLLRLWKLVHPVYRLAEDLELLGDIGEFYVDGRYPASIETGEPPSPFRDHLAQMLEYSEAILNGASAHVRQARRFPRTETPE